MKEDARSRIEAAGRAPLLGWAQDRTINLSETDIRRTFEEVRLRMAFRRAMARAIESRQHGNHQEK